MKSDLNELLLRWHELRSRGQDAAPEDLCRDCPELAPELARRIQVLASMLELVAPTGPYQPAASVTAQPQIRPALNNSADIRFAPGYILAGRYRIVSRLGKGGMGEVYRADDLRLGQSVALKFLPDDRTNDPQRLAALHEEVKLARQVSHANVCRVYDIGEADGHTFLSMEFIDGEDLASLLRRIGRLPPDKGVEIARQLCLGLAAAHEKGVIHRDLKPANVMLDGRGHVRITDFGLARLTAQVVGADVRSGTPAYMAQEQLAGKEVTQRSDIYALGLVLYEIFTGKKAFKAATPVELAKLQEHSSPPSPSSHVSELNPTIERVILRCLEFDPRSRPNSALAVAAALPGGDPLAAALAAGELPSPEIVAAATDGDIWPMRNAVFCLVGAVAALAACVLLYPHGTLVGRARMPESTGELKRKAQEILKELGYPETKDKAIGFDHDRACLDWLGKQNSPTRWEPLSRPNPAALYFWYRQSPEYLVPDLYYPYQGTLEPGRITLADPALVIPGMVSVKLDVNGHLLELQAVPPDIEANFKDPPPAPDWNALFKSAGLEMAKFRKVSPYKIPPAFANERQAWTGNSPELKDQTIWIEAAAFNGRPVYFQIFWDWTPWTHEEQFVGSQGVLDQAGTYFSAIMFIFILAAAAFWAPVNWRLGRADRIGAFRLALWSFVILMVVWVFETHHVPTIDELKLFVLGLAFAGYWSGLLWLSYIALEPIVRRLWPECLITWTRFLTGQWLDARLGRDLLIGVLVGLVFQILDLAGRVIPAHLAREFAGALLGLVDAEHVCARLLDGEFLDQSDLQFPLGVFLQSSSLLGASGATQANVARRWHLGYLVLCQLDRKHAGFEPSWYWLFVIVIYILGITLC